MPLEGMTRTCPGGAPAVWRSEDGGGAWGGSLYNCVLTGNSGGAGAGGGAIECTLYDCTLSGNTARMGGGAYRCTLINCTVVGNAAYDDGGLGGGGGAGEDVVGDGSQREHVQVFASAGLG